MAPGPQDPPDRDNRDDERPETPQRRTDADKAALRDYCIERFDKTPAMALADRAFMDPLDYARKAGKTRGKGAAKVWDQPWAFSQQGRDLERLLPYTEKKMPVEVEVGETSRVILQVGRLDTPEATAIEGTARRIELMPANIVQKQRFSESAPEASHNKPSHKDD